VSDTALTLNRVQEGGLLRHPCPIGVVASENVDGVFRAGLKLGGHTLYTAHCEDCQIFFKFRFYPDPLNITMVEEARGPLGLPTCPSCKQHLVFGT